MAHEHNNKAQNCCSDRDIKINNKNRSDNHHGHSHDHDDHGHSHDVGDSSTFSLFLPAIISFLLLGLGIIFDQFIPQNWFKDWVRLVWYLLAYAPVGLPVLKEAFESIRKGDVFSEFFLMGIATVGAFAIKEYPEGVAVMLFYAVGEVFQTLAVTKAKSNIKSLLDQRPDEVTILKNNIPEIVKAESVQIGDIIQLKPGEKLGLDGELITEGASFNTAALTGESKPDSKSKGDAVLAGMINLQTVSQIKVTAA